MTRDVGPARGVLRHAPGPGAFRHVRIAPSVALADWVQHYWIVQWDLLGLAGQTRETLPHPNVHLVIDETDSRIHGIQRGRFTRLLEGRGGVFGVKFRAGGFRPFLGHRVSSLQGRSLALAQVFGGAGAALEGAVRAAADDTARVAVAEAFLAAHRPAADAMVGHVAHIVETIEADRSLVTVERVMQRFDLGKRALQRLFNEYVGVGPKWVIGRYRLHEALARLATGETLDWTALALELGYFDQAHFIRDFKALVGRAPGEYLRATGR